MAIRSYRSGFNWLTRFVALLIASLSAGIPVKAQEPEELAPNIVLVTIDALRADHVSCYGYPRKTTPFIDGLASKGILFKNAYATSPWTVPSMASIFSGLYPVRHGVVNGLVKKGKIHGQEILADSFETIAEVLKKKGYRTYGISSNLHVNRESGMAQGFDEFADLGFCPADEVKSAFLSMKDSINSGGPYFLWIHLFDPHVPYVARRPWIRRYAQNTKLVQEWSGRDKINLLKKEIEKDPGIISALVALYDSEINYADQALKEIISALASPDVIAVTSDHGEAFLEHGQLTHRMTVFDEEVRVPLIIVAPGKIPSVVSRPVSNIDVFSAIVELAAARMPAGLDADRVFGERNSDPVVFSSLDVVDRPSWKAVRSGRWKYIEGEMEGSPSAMLFDLVSDPGERSNMVEQNPDKVDQLAAHVIEYLSAPPVQSPQKPVSLTEQQKRQLESLGYTR